jgi:hypothetical protein
LTLLQLLLQQFLLTGEQPHLLHSLLHFVFLLVRGGTNGYKLNTFFVGLVPPLTVFSVAQQSDLRLIIHYRMRVIIAMPLPLEFANLVRTNISCKFRPFDSMHVFEFISPEQSFDSLERCLPCPLNIMCTHFKITNKITRFNYI